MPSIAKENAEESAGPRRRQERAALAVAFGLAFAQAALVLALPYPVGADTGNHITIVSVLSRFTELGFDRHFLIDWVPTPYLMANGLALAFSKALGVVAAFKSVAAIYLLLLPAASLYWIRSFPGADVRKVLFASAFALSNPFFGGSFNHLWGLMTGLVVAGFWVRHRDGPPARRRAGLALGLLALYFSHFTLFALFSAILFGSAMLDRERPRLRIEMVAALIPPALLFAWFSRASNLAGGVPETSTAAYGGYLQALFARLAFPFTAFRFWTDFLPQVPTVAAFGALGLTGLRRGIPDRLVGVALGLCAAAVLLLPHTHVLTHPIACRVAHAGLFLALPLLAPLRSAALAAVALGAAAWTTVAGGEMIRLQRPLGDYARILERIPPDQAVFPLFEKDVKGPESRIFSPFEYLVGLYHAEKGGVSPNIPDRPRSPWAAYLFYRDARFKADSVLLADFDPARWAPIYPYVVYRGTKPGLLKLLDRYSVEVREGDVWLLVRSGDPE